MSLKIGLACLALLTGAMYSDTLVAPGTLVLGDARADLALHFPWILAAFLIWRRERDLARA